MKRKYTLYVSRKQRRLGIGLLLFIYWLVLVCLLSACKTQQPTVTVPRNDSIIATHDHTIGVRFIRDSIFIRERSDTVWLERWHTEYRDSVRTVCDTIHHYREVVKQLPPERYIPPWAWWALGFSIVVVLLVIARIILRIYLLR